MKERIIFVSSLFILVSLIIILFVLRMYFKKRVVNPIQKLKDAEAKGLLNLTEQEQAALDELKQAAAEVNTPLNSSLTPAKDQPHDTKR